MPKILFVDDEPLVITSLQRGLRGEPYEFAFATSGDQALQVLKEESIQVMVTDMRMPMMNGLDLLKIVKQDYPLVVKIVLSGYAQLPQVLAAVNQGDIFRFITKPWDLEADLKVALREALAHAELVEKWAQGAVMLENSLAQNPDNEESTESNGDLAHDFHILKNIHDMVQSLVVNRLLKAQNTPQTQLAPQLLQDIARWMRFEANFISSLPHHAMPLSNAYVIALIQDNFNTHMPKAHMDFFGNEVNSKEVLGNGCAAHLSEFINALAQLLYFSCPDLKVRMALTYQHHERLSLNGIFMTNTPQDKAHHDEIITLLIKAYQEALGATHSWEGNALHLKMDIKLT